MKLKDILTSDEIKELKAIKPENNVIYASAHICNKIRKAERAGHISKLPSIKERQ